MQYLIFGSIKAISLALFFVVAFLMLKLVDKKLLPEINFAEELLRDNRSVSFVVGATILAFGIAIGFILG